eukprot:ANDGO_04815.mRNA.1 26S proteasome non-ATPase regulatory subunit 1 homolog B
MPPGSSMVYSSASASSVLALLAEPSIALQTQALRVLQEQASTLWAEASDQLPLIESLADDPAIPIETRRLASLVAAKVYFHLGATSDALDASLRSGELFRNAMVSSSAADSSRESTEFVSMVVGAAIDRYIAVRVKNWSQNAPSADQGSAADRALDVLIEDVFTQCYATGKLREALGIAVECRRLDHMEKAIKQAGSSSDADQKAGLLDFAEHAAMSYVSDLEFRAAVLRMLIRLHSSSLGRSSSSSSSSLSSANNNESEEMRLAASELAVARCLVALDDAPSLAETLFRLLSNGQTLVAFQVCFDVATVAKSHFVQELVQSLQKQDSSAESTVTSVGQNLKAALSILRGEANQELQRDFLTRQSHSDMSILNYMKTTLDTRNSISHGALIAANGLMHAGTGVDSFLRSNIDWMSRASYWNKFSAAASLGVIHAGAVKESETILEHFFASQEPYSYAGGLLARAFVGGASKIERIREALKNAIAIGGGMDSGALNMRGMDMMGMGGGGRERPSGPSSSTVIQHGACLAFGVAALRASSYTSSTNPASSSDGSSSTAVWEGMYDELRDIVYQDDAVAGEAAALAIGLSRAGTLPTGTDESVLSDMLTYARETQHEKIIRGIALGLACMCCGREAAADSIIEQLIADKDPILRAGAMQCLAAAYAGTGHSAAVRKALHIAVSDVSDDVRRAAVISLGFVLRVRASVLGDHTSKQADDRCPRLVSLLAQSYNPHVRYGATLAVGICCAGTALRAAIDLLKPLAEDPVDFVRQGAYIGLAMVLMQTNETREPFVAEFRDKIDRIVSDRHAPIMAKLGAILSAGFLDAGGRNVTLDATGGMRQTLGALIGCQQWFWYPYIHFFSLAFVPTHVTALNEKLQMPRMEIVSHAKPSQFAYPAVRVHKKEDDSLKKKMVVVELSTSSKHRQREKEKGKDKKEGAKAASQTVSGAAAAPAVPSEPTSERLQNPARVTAEQTALIEFPSGPEARYVPVKGTRGVVGMVMVRDRRPAEPEDILEEHMSEAARHVAQEGPEAAPPAPFQFP